MATARAAEGTISPTAALPGGPNSRIYVVFTDSLGTKAALTAASRLARGLDLPLALLAARVVPYPLPLEQPQVPVEFLERAMSELVNGLDAPVTVQIILCRDPNQALRNAIRPKSLVVIGACKGRWRSRHRRLARLLREDGRILVIVD